MLSDRKKDLVKLQGGEYVSLGKVETALKLHPLIENCCVCADSTKMYTVVLVVPSLKHLRVLATRIGLDAENLPGMCNSKAVELEVLKAMQEQAKKSEWRLGEDFTISAWDGVGGGGWP